MATLRERLAQDLEIRGRSPRTQETYVACVKNFVEHFDLPPGKLGLEHIREYQLLLIHERGISWSYFNQIVCALRFFFNVTLRRGWDIDRLPYQKRERRLPEILSPEEVATMLAVTDRLRDRAILMALYGAGLRLGEVRNLCVADIDSGRMVLRVVRGKGRKDRYVRLPDALLRELRTYWKASRPGGSLLFPGKNPDVPLSDGAIQKMVKTAARRAGIAKRITPHSLRHAYATHHLEQGTNLREIQLLLGHRSLNSTAIYTHVARNAVAAAASPLDGLPAVTRKQVRKHT
jgi:site-specific recombinase XerD